MLSKCTCSLDRPAWRHCLLPRYSTVSVSVPMLVPQPSFANVSACPASAVTEVLPCPESATEVHRSTFSTLATATGTWGFLRLPNNPNFPGQSSVASCPELRLPLGSSHPQLCICEKDGLVREPLRTEAAKLTHTCGLVDEILIVRRVKLESNPLFRNQRVNVGLGAA